jgi:hypothetical protein
MTERALELSIPEEDKNAASFALKFLLEERIGDLSVSRAISRDQVIRVVDILDGS